MNELGIYLKKLRTENGYSQKKVHDATGITDSQQSRIERGLNQEISPLSLKKLASFYNVNVIDLYILAGWISQNDLEGYQRIFMYAELLTDSQKKNIQNEIILFTEGNGGNHNAI
ncbi:MAG: helix-turn-helix transcriptional regulator [Eubacteriales bacterium]|nr:helix-turn-helix transcriptional regulator [Eubacteriales bacterium]